MIKLDGNCYESLLSLRPEADPGLYMFLEEWLDDKPYVIGHTSGSTGAPKEIRLSKQDMRASARLTNQFFGIGPGSVLLLCLSVSYIAGKMMVVRALEAGADLIVVEPSSSPLVGVGRPVDLAAMVPMQVEGSLGQPEKMNLVRQLIIGGAPVMPVMEERLRRIGTVCYATYGMTETVSHVALRRLNAETGFVAVGDTSFSVDERGCLVIRAPHLEACVFVTNDLVNLISPSRFEWLGRYDHVINSGGLKFFPEVLESKLAACIVARYYITSLPDVRLGQQIVLVIEGEPWDEARLEALRGCLHDRLTSYEIPRKILFLPYFRETSSGKVIRDNACLSERL